MTTDGLHGHPVARSHRLLVVDDNIDLAESLALLLELTGYEVRTAYTGRTALAVAHGFQPEIVLLDLGLPDLDGCEVARQLRAHPLLTSVGFFHYPLLDQLAGHRLLPGVPARALGNPVPVVGDDDSAERPG